MSGEKALEPEFRQANDRANPGSAPGFLLSRNGSCWPITDTETKLGLGLARGSANDPEQTSCRSATKRLLTTLSRHQASANDHGKVALGVMCVP